MIAIEKEPNDKPKLIPKQPSLGRPFKEKNPA